MSGMAMDVAQPAGEAAKGQLSSSQWRLFYGMMAYGAVVSVVVPLISALVTRTPASWPFYVANLIVGLVLIGFVNYVIVKVTLRNFLVKFLEKFNPLVDQPLPKPGNPLQSTELDNLDALFSKLMQQLAEYIASSVSQQTLLERLQRYFSPALAQQLAGDPEALDRTADMNVTVLFADIRNFTHMSSQLEPQQVVSILNDYFGAMIDLVQESGGTVLKLIGDAVMAVYGAPLPQQDDALRAVSVTPKMHAAFDELQKKWRAEGLKENIGMGIGINRGTVVVGNIGSSHHLDYTAIGDTVNVASRLSDSGVAHAGETIIARPVADALAGMGVTLEAREPVHVKGKDEAQEIFYLRAVDESTMRLAQTLPEVTPTGQPGERPAQATA